MQAERRAAARFKAEFAWSAQSFVERAAFCGTPSLLWNAQPSVERPVFLREN
jgi:hypothetical protein